MNIDRKRRIERRIGRGIALAALPLLASCQHDDMASFDPQLSSFGEANRQTMMAQVVDPAPEYEYLDPATSGKRAADAAERYRADKVKKPERVRSTQSTGGSSN